MSSRTITLTSIHDEVIKLHAPDFYHINRNLKIFQNAREAIMHRFIHEEFAIVAPDPWINLQLAAGERSDKSSSCTWSDEGNGTGVQTITYVTSSDSTYDNSMSLFSKSDRQNSDVTVGLDGSADLFSSNRESSVELSDSRDETLSASTADDAHEVSSTPPERILKRKPPVFLF